jgi:hypothetical protein
VSWFVLHIALARLVRVELTIERSNRTLVADWFVCAGSLKGSDDILLGNGDIDYIYDLWYIAVIGYDST